MLNILTIQILIILLILVSSFFWKKNDFIHFFSIDIGKEYMENRTEFNRKALEMIKKYGLPRNWIIMDEFYPFFYAIWFVFITNKNKMFIIIQCCKIRRHSKAYFWRAYIIVKLQRNNSIYSNPHCQYALHMISHNTIILINLKYLWSTLYFIQSYSLNIIWEEIKGIIIIYRTERL